jgi:hypothetical protein
VRKKAREFYWYVIVLGKLWVSVIIFKEENRCTGVLISL